MTREPLTESFRKVRFRFLAAVSIVLATVVMLFVWNAVREYRLVISAAEKSSASYASALKEHAERVLAEADNCIRDITDEINDNGGIASTQSEKFYRKLRQSATSGPQFSSVYVVDKNGLIIAHSQEFGIKPVNLADRDYFLHHRNNPSSGLFISTPFVSRVSGTSRFSLSRPLKDDSGGFLGIVAVTYEASYFQKFYTSIEIGSTGRITLASTNGEILVQEPHHTAPPLSSLTRSPLFTVHVPQNPKDTIQFISSLSGDMRIVSYQKLDSFPVVAIVSFNKNEVASPWRLSLYKQLAILLLLIAAVVQLSRMFLSQFMKLDQTRAQLQSQSSDLQIKAELLDSASDAILLLDGNGRLNYFNNALCVISGRRREELASSLIQAIEPPEYAENATENIRALIDSGQDAVFESAYLGKTGEMIPVEVHARPVVTSGEAQILSVVRDIRDRKEADRKMSAIAREWRETFDSVEDVIWLLNMDRVILRANRATQTTFSISQQQALGMRCCDIIHTDSTQHETCPFDEMKTNGKRATAQVSLNRRWYEITLDPVFDEGGTVINAVHVTKDITALKQSELREHLRSEILERIARGDSLTDLLSFIARSIEQERPEALCSILLVSRDGKRLLSGAAPSLPDAYNTAVHLTRIGEGIGSCGTAAFRRERVVVEDISVHPFWKNFSPATDAGLRSCWSEPIISSSGKLLGTFAIYHRETALPGEDEIRLIEQASAFASIAIERSRNEEERNELEEQLHQSQKMEAIGHLAGGMAHDFNNLLTPIVIYSEMLKKTIPDDTTKLQSRLEAISSAALKARDLIQQLLSFGRKQLMETKPVDLNEIVSSFLTIIRRTLRENIEIELRLSPQQQVISADSSKIEQIILNLAINAQDAIAENGDITIETGQVLIDNEYARTHPDLLSGSYVLLQITDSGCGMSKETLKHIFEPFYTTKQPGQGTGLGLANVYGIVKQHNGHIEVQSSINSGTAFRIYFPALDSLPDATVSAEASISFDHAGSGTILLVEDNDMVREMAEELLSELGYAVLAEDHPQKALDRVSQHNLEIDLVVTDVVMPGMNGRRFFESLKREQPKIGKVLYMSGYDNEVMSEGKLGEGEYFLQKPFTIDSFQAKIKEILNS